MRLTGEAASGVSLLDISSGNQIFGRTAGRGDGKSASGGYNEMSSAADKQDVGVVVIQSSDRFRYCDGAINEERAGSVAQAGIDD